MSKSFFIIVLYILFCSPGHSQKFDLGDVTKAELAEKVHPTDTSAVAAVLFKKAKTTFRFSTEKGFVSNTEFSVKIKIYKKEGLQWANFEIPYYTAYEGLEDDNVEIIKAFTYNLEAGKIQKEKVSGESKFVEQVNEFWKRKVITFPNVKVGSIIEFRYSLKSEDISVLPDFQYQYKIPVNYAEFKIEIPVFFLYNAIRIGFVEVVMNEKVEPTSQRYQVQVDLIKQSQTLNYNQIVTTYVASDIPALVEEEYVNSMDNYYAKIEHELQTVQYPDQKPKQIATTWESVAASIYESKKFGAELNKYNYFLDDVKRLVANANSDQEKTAIIFEFLKNRMNWNGKYGYQTKKGVETAYAEKSGNVAEINLILTAMLKMAGLDAKPVLISTRSNGIAVFPSRIKFNYVIAGVKIGDAIVYLDATSKNASDNILPIRNLNGKGRMIGRDGTSTEVDVIPKTISNNTIELTAAINDDGTITGKLKRNYFDYNGYLFRENDAKLSNESRVEIIEKKYDGIEVDEYTSINTNELSQPVIETYSFKDNNDTELIGDKMFFSPMLFFALAENPFKQQKREYPIDFAFARQDKYLINISLPKGYKVESLPESVSVPIGGGIGSFKYALSKSDGQIQLSVILDIKSALILPNYYSELKTFFSEVIKKETEKIVLKKV